MAYYIRNDNGGSTIYTSIDSARKAAYNRVKNYGGSVKIYTSKTGSTVAGTVRAKGNGIYYSSYSKTYGASDSALNSSGKLSR